MQMPDRNALPKKEMHLQLALQFMCLLLANLVNEGHTRVQKLMSQKLHTANSIFISFLAIPGGIS